MFLLQTATPIDQRVFLITSNYEVLHFDEEPILFTGLTAFQNRVIGSLVEEEQDEFTKEWYSRFFYKLVDSSTYASFLNHKLTYQDVIKKNELVFIFDDYYQGESKAYSTNWEAIPSEYLPTSESYCPLLKEAKSLQYVVSLKGKLADRYIALASDLGHIQKSFTGLLANAVNALGSLGYDLDIYQTAYTPGSFQLGFQAFLKLKNGQRDIFDNQADWIKAYNLFVQYCLEHLPQEAETLLGEFHHNPSPHYEQLREKLKELFEGNLSVFDTQREAAIKASFHSALNNVEELTKNIGNNYSEIGIFNLEDSEQKVEMANLTLEDRAQIEDSIVAIESVHATKDDEPQVYTIHVYSLNTDTRKGAAFIKSDSMTVSKPKIKILGKSPLDGSRFTESLHLNTYIEVTAIAHWQNERCTSLEVMYD